MRRGARPGSRSRRAFPNGTDRAFSADAAHGIPMKPEDRALLIAVAAVVALAAGGGASILAFSRGLPESLPVPGGTVFSANATEHWAAHFTVGASGVRLVGAWTAFDGIGPIVLLVVNGTVSKPYPPPLLHCPLLFHWSVYNGTVDRALEAGTYTVYWNTGFCAYAAEIHVTQTIQLATR